MFVLIHREGQNEHIDLDMELGVEIGIHCVSSYRPYQFSFRDIKSISRYGDRAITANIVVSKLLVQQTFKVFLKQMSETG